MAVLDLERTVTAGTKVDLVKGRADQLAISIANASLLPATYQADMALDGVPLGKLSASVPGGQTVVTTFPLSSKTTPGMHQVTIGSMSLTFRVPVPAKFHVTHLTLSQPVAKLGQKVTASVEGSNDGEVAGMFPSDCAVNGKPLAGVSAVRVDPGESASTSFSFSESRTGKFRLAVHDLSKTLVVVKPVRLATGTYIRRSVSGGLGKITIRNGYPRDVMACLTKWKKGGKFIALTSAGRSLLSVYIRSGQSFTISAIPNGTYRLYYALGRDWNRYTRSFLSIDVRRRSKAKMSFGTSTRSWDTPGYRHWATQYVHYLIKLNPAGGGNMPVEEVRPEDFPEI